MIGSIEHLWRLIPKRPLVPVMLLVVGVSATPDPNRRATGYGGVLPVPSAPASPAHVDSLLQQQRRDVRAARGRVLYAPGHAPSMAEAKPARKRSCPEQRIVQGRSSSTSPNS